MPIKNLEGLSDAEIEHELQNGAKFVVFQYTISIVVMTFKRSTEIHFIRAGESPFKYAIGPTIISFLFGWWGIPWGPIYTIGSLFKNLSGGTDVTGEILSQLAPLPTTRQPVFDRQEYPGPASGPISGPGTHNLPDHRE